MQKNQFIPSAYLWDTVSFSVLESSDQIGHTHFWPCPHKKVFDQRLIFVNLYQHVKNQFIPSVHSSDTANFRVLSPDWTHPFLTMLTPKIFNQIIPFVHSGDTVNFRVHRPDWPHLFLTMPNQKIFDQLDFCEFVSACKELDCFINLF